MTVVGAGLKFLRLSEKLMMIVIIVFGTYLSWMGIVAYGTWSLPALGPIAMMGISVYRTLAIGVMRLRMMTLNVIFVQIARELAQLGGGELPDNIKAMIAAYFGDKK